MLGEGNTDGARFGEKQYELKVPERGTDPGYGQ